MSTTSAVPLLNRPRIENQQVSTVTQYIKAPTYCAPWNEGNAVSSADGSLSSLEKL